MDYYASKRWGLGKKILFRFTLLYILLYTLPSPYDAVPGISALSEYFNSFWNSIATWFGAYVLLIDGDINTQFTGSADRLIDYLQVLIILAISAVGTLIWSILDYQRLNYKKLIYWFRLHVRYYLFAVLFVYGIVKIIDSQFSYLGIWILLQPFGDTSPMMGFAGSALGFSKSYTFFIGMIELLAASLLLFRKTTTFGALLALVVMSNLMAINIGYDLPMKLLSIHFVFFSIVVLAFDGKRLLNILLLNRSTTSVRYQKIFRDRWDRIGFFTIKTLFIGYIIISSSLYTFQRYQQIEPDRELPALYGVWEVESYEIDNSEATPQLPDDDKWQLMIIESEGNANIINMNHTKNMYEAEVDTSQQNVVLSNGDESYAFEYTEQNSKIILSGEKEGESLVIELRRQDPDKFRLVNGKINWIQEYFITADV